MEDKGCISERTHGCVDCSEIVPRVVPLRKGRIYGMICTSAEQMNGLVNICIVEKITKFDNDIFLDFRAAGESFAGSTIRLRMACP